MIGSPAVELPMVVEEILDVEAGKPVEAVEKEMPVGPRSVENRNTVVVSVPGVNVVSVPGVNVVGCFLRILS